jgi:hypothetical protein
MLAADRKGRTGLLIGVGAGLIIAALLVVQAATISGGGGGGSGPSTATEVESTSLTSSTTTMMTTTTTTASASSGAPAPVLGGLYYVTFYDSGPCGANSTSGPHFVEWGVQLGNRTRTVPPNITLSDIPEDGYSASSDFTATRIVFLVPPGSYPFTLYPTAFMAVGTPDGVPLGGATGVITVTNSDMTVYTASVAFSAECSQ